MIDTKELRKVLARHGTSVINEDEVLELLDRLEAAEKSDAESIAMYRKVRDERDALHAKIARMEQQEPIAKVRVHQTGGNAGLAWSVAPLNDFDSLPLMRDGDRLYALPGAQNVPKEAIAKILTEVMDIAVSNGADSRSMPDEYVEVAAWLCGIPAQNAPSAPENYFGMTLHDKIEAMENKL